MQIKNLKWLMVSLLVMIFDQYSKYLVITKLSLGKPIAVIANFFNLTLAYNTGAAFSFLANSSGWQRWLFAGIAIIVTLGLVTWLMKVSQQQKWLMFALSLIIGGALGNLIDRIRLSYVIDFLDVYYKNYHWPAFNVADSAVVAGAIILAICFCKE